LPVHKKEINNNIALDYDLIIKEGFFCFQTKKKRNSENSGTAFQKRNYSD
jgi:hypothetical protein